MITSASALLAVWLATMQIVLDKGQEADWFGAEWVRWFTLISVFAFIGVHLVGISNAIIRWWTCAFSRTGISPSA